jgi:hypothetical protein
VALEPFEQACGLFFVFGDVAGEVSLCSLM